MFKFAVGLSLGGACAWYQRGPSSSSSEASSSPAQLLPTADCIIHPTGKAAECPLSPSEWRDFRLLNTRYESHDTRRFTFAIEGDGQQHLNIPAGSCILLKYNDSGDGDKEVIRPYTPLTTNDDLPGRFDIMVKRYPRSKMGGYLHSMRPGENLAMKGPYVKYPHKTNQKKHIGMLAAGTGIAPMYQIIRACLDNPSDTSRVTLLYGNKSRKDMLLANELCEYSKVHKRFHLYLTLDEAPKKWLGGVGLITKELITAFLPKPGEKDSVILVCGPPPFMKAYSGEKDYSGSSPQQGKLGGMLKDLGYGENQVFKF